MEKAATFFFADLPEGFLQLRNYAISPEVYQRFLETFGDRSPIHTNEPDAQSAGFKSCVMHGAILNGFLSHFIGMVLPGEASLLLSTELRYSHPCYLGDQLQLQGKIVQRVESQKIVVLHIVFHNITQDRKAATGRVQVKLRK